MVLTAADIDATLSDGVTSETATVTQHLQTLKNDEKDLGDQVAGIERVIGDISSALDTISGESV